MPIEGVNLQVVGAEETAGIFENARFKEGDFALLDTNLGDVIPAIEAGGWGVHVPHELTWALEHADTPHDAERFREIASLADLPELVSAIDDR